MENEDFREWLTQFNLADTSFRMYVYIVKRFLKEGYDIYSNKDVNIFLKKHPNPNYRAALKWFMKFKKIKDYELIRPKKQKKKIKDVMRYEELEEWVEKLKSKDETVYWVYKVALMTGARIHEILNIKLSDIVVDNYTEEPANYIILRKTKTGDERKVAIDNPDNIRALKELVIWAKGNGKLSAEKIFFTNWKPRNAYFELRKKIRKYLPPKIAKVFRRTHNFRRAIINHILEKTNGNLFSAKAFIGHRSIQSTERYVTEFKENKEAVRVSRLI